MPFSLTTEQILAMAPDAPSAKAGQSLASRSKWVTLGANDQALWGECQGSGKAPYQVQVDLATGDLAYRCSCPSRKQPCKHILGLLLLRATEADAFATTTPPDWVADWLAKRAQAAQKRSEQHEQRQVSDPTAQAKRAIAREAKIRAGLRELEQWLHDLIRQGLADVQSRPATFWFAPASRMIDAQAPGVARLLRELAGIPNSGPGWQGRLLEHLGRLHLLIEGFKRLETLPPAIQADIRTAIGLTIREDDLRDEPGIRDHWLVLGQRVETEDTLTVQRTWLWGQTSNRPALVLSFAAGNQPLDRSLLPDTSLEADLVFYPGAVPLRALVKTRHSPVTTLDPSVLPGMPTIHAASATYAAALAAQPWLERYPFLLRGIDMVYRDRSWAVRDAEGYTLACPPHFAAGWQLLARSGGHPSVVAGEWDGTWLLPLNLWTLEECV